MVANRRLQNALFNPAHSARTMHPLPLNQQTPDPIDFQDPDQPFSLRFLAPASDPSQPKTHPLHRARLKNPGLSLTQIPGDLPTEAPQYHDPAA